jgi:hypothetical protein
MGRTRSARTPVGRLDGFHLVSGLAAAVAGPVLFAAGEMRTWSIVITATGLTVLWAQWRIVRAAHSGRTPDARAAGCGSGEAPERGISHRDHLVGAGVER